MSGSAGKRNDDYFIRNLHHGTCYFEQVSFAIVMRKNVHTSKIKTSYFVGFQPLHSHKCKGRKIGSNCNKNSKSGLICCL